MRACNFEAGYGRCEGTGCVSETLHNECGGRWCAEPSVCKPCDPTTRGACVGGSCMGSGVGCVNDSIPEERTMGGAERIANPGGCR